MCKWGAGSRTMILKDQDYSIVYLVLNQLYDPGIPDQILHILVGHLKYLHTMFRCFNNHFIATYTVHFIIHPHRPGGQAHLLFEALGIIWNNPDPPTFVSVGYIFPVWSLFPVEFLLHSLYKMGQLPVYESFFSSWKSVGLLPRSDATITHLPIIGLSSIRAYFYFVLSISNTLIFSRTFNYLN